MRSSTPLHQTRPPHEQATPPAETELVEAIESAVGYVVDNQRADGSFVYRARAAGPLRSRHGYNILRHAGTLYALSHAIECGHLDTAGVEILRRGAGYLADRVVEVPGSPGRLAVATVTRLDGGCEEEAKLGAAGLGLVALLAAERWCPGTTPVSVLRGIGEFILLLQQPDGRFHSKYRIADPVGPCGGWQSLYYPGEAALGLVELADHQADDRYARAAVDGLLHLARSRADVSAVPPDHWALIATARAFEISSSSTLGHTERELLRRHGRQICSRIVTTAPDPSESHGALSADRSVCSTATMLEGLLAARSSLDLGELEEPVDDRIESGIAFLLASRLRRGSNKGAFLDVGPVSGTKVVGRPAPAGAAALPGAPPTGRPTTHKEPGIRIDFVQHAISALVGYWSRHWIVRPPRPLNRRPASPIRRPATAVVASTRDVAPYQSRLLPVLESVCSPDSVCRPDSIGAPDRSRDRSVPMTFISLRDRDHPGLFQLAVDVAESRDQILYRARLIVVGPGIHTLCPSPTDRRTWACDRRHMVVTDGVRLVTGSEPGYGSSLASGDVRRVDPLASTTVENPTRHPVVLLEVFSRSKPPALREAAFERLDTDIDVAPLAMEFCLLLLRSSEPERRRLLVPHHETHNLKLRTEWQIIGEDQPPGEQQRGHYTALCHQLPELYGWVDGFCRRAGLEPGRIRVVVMKPGGHALPHYDGGSYYRLRDRYLLCVSGGASTLTAGDQTIRPQPGELWRFDNQLLHEATNYGTEPRVHVYFDARPWAGPDPSAGDAPTREPFRSTTRMSR